MLLPRISYRIDAFACRPVDINGYDKYISVGSSDRFLLPRGNMEGARCLSRASSSSIPISPLYYSTIE